MRSAMMNSQAAAVTMLDPLASEIVAALRYFRGVCHRRQVIEYILAAHRRAGERIAEDFPDAIIDAFNQWLGQGEDDPRPFRLPFGPGSHRWALAPASL